jgi:hypothetical protein
MTRGKGKQSRPKEILSASEKEAIIDQRKELEATLKERESYGVGTKAEQIDVAKVTAEIKRLDQAIADRLPPKVRGVQKDRMAKEAESIEESLRAGMPTRDEMRFPGKNPGAVRKHMNWVKRNAGNIERYRNIQRTLNPQDPRSIENLRRDK